MRSRWWQAVTAVGILATIGFVILAAVEDLGLLAQAVIPLVGVVLTARGRLVGALIIGVFSLLEVVFVPFYDRETTLEWIAQTVAWVVGAVGLVAVGGLLLERRRLG